MDHGVSRGAGKGSVSASDGHATAEMCIRDSIEEQHLDVVAAEQVDPSLKMERVTVALDDARMMDFALEVPARQTHSLQHPVLRVRTLNRVPQRDDDFAVGKVPRDPVARARGREVRARLADGTGRIAMPKIIGIPLDALMVVLPPESGLFDVMR